MPIVIDRPVVFTKATNNAIKISREAIRLIPKVAVDPYYRDVSVWKEICFNLMGNPENEIEVVKFDGTVAQPIGIFSVSYRSSNSFYLGSIVIHDFDGGTLTVDIYDFPEDTSLNFDINFPLEQLINPTLSISIGNEAINLSWTPLSTIPDYQIWRKIGNAPFIKIVPNHANNSYVDTDVVGNQTYQYYVVLDYDEDLYTSNTVSISTTSPVATTITRTLTSTGMQLTWTASAGATQYRLYRSTVSGAFTTAYKTFGSGTLLYVEEDSDLSYGTQYYYMMRAFSGFLSTNSNEVTYRPIAAINHTATNLDDARILIEWASVVGATSYNMFYRQVGMTPWGSVMNVTSPYTSNVFNGETQYDIYMQATNITGASEVSPITRITTTEKIIPPMILESTYAIVGTPTPNSFHTVRIEIMPTATQYLIYGKGETGSFTQVDSVFSLNGGPFQGSQGGVVTTSNGKYIYSIAGTNVLPMKRFYYVIAKNTSGVILAKSNQVAFKNEAILPTLDFFYDNGNDVGGNNWYILTNRGDIDFGKPNTMNVVDQNTNPSPSLNYGPRDIALGIPTYNDNGTQVWISTNRLYVASQFYQGDSTTYKIGYGYTGRGVAYTNTITITAAQGVTAGNQTPPPSVTDIQVTKNAGPDFGVTLTWPAIAGATGYVIYHNNNPINYASIVTPDFYVTTNSIYLHHLNNINDDYYFGIKVRIGNQVGDGFTKTSLKD